jgi:RNA polymerase sigma-70 factor (family 1)
MENNSKVYDENNTNSFIKLGVVKHQLSEPIAIDTEFQIKNAFSEDSNLGITMLFRAYYLPLCSHALRFVSSKAIAEDLVSDVFYEFHTKNLYLNITTSYRAYLFTTIRNRAFDFVKTEMKRQTALENADYVALSNEQNPDSITQYDEFYEDVQNAISSMPIKRKQIYLMNRFDGRKSNDIASELNLSTRTVEAHLYQAALFLKNTLKDKWLITILGFFNF